jgi:hypothetical protein
MTPDDATKAQPDPAITPTRQKLVALFDSFIVAVLLPDGRIAATLSQ